MSTPHTVPRINQKIVTSGSGGGNPERTVGDVEDIDGGVRERQEMD